MEDSWYVSKRLWAALLTVLAMIAGFFGIEVDAETQQLIVGHVHVVISGVLALVAVALDVVSKYKSTRR